MLCRIVGHPRMSHDPINLQTPIRQPYTALIDKIQQRIRLLPLNTPLDHLPMDNTLGPLDMTHPPVPLVHEFVKSGREGHGQVHRGLISELHAHLPPLILASLPQLEGHGTQPFLEAGEVITEGEVDAFVAPQEGHFVRHEDGEGHAEGKDVGLEGDGVAEHGGRAAVLVGDTGLPVFRPGGVGCAAEVDDGHLGVMSDLDVVFLVEDLLEGVSVALGGKDEVSGLVGFVGFSTVEGGCGDDHGSSEDGHDLTLGEKLEAVDLGEDVGRTEVAVVDADFVEELHGPDDAAAEPSAVEFPVHGGGDLDVSPEDGDDVAEVAAVGTVEPEVSVGDGDLVLEGVGGAEVHAFEELGQLHLGAVEVGGFRVVDFEGLPWGGFGFPVLAEPDNAVRAVT